MSTLTKISVWLFAVVSLVACGDKQISAVTATDHTTVAQTTPNRLPALSKDMAYADLRRQVSADGWQPVSSPQCKANVGIDAAVCEQVTELESCSGDGYCVMHFARNAEKISVYTYGMLEDWSVPGEQSRLRVTEWELDR